VGIGSSELGEDADPAEEFYPYEESDLAEDFDPTLYPRTYRMSLGWRLMILTWGVLLTLGLSAVVARNSGVNSR